MVYIVVAYSYSCTPDGIYIRIVSDNIIDCALFKKQQLESNGRQVKNVIGFDCEFLEPPPENLQTSCPVCLQIIREPYQVPCCGKKCCQS